MVSLLALLVPDKEEDFPLMWLRPPSASSLSTPPLTALPLFLQSYDTEGRGYITYQEFLHRLGIRYSPKVHRPYKEDYFNFLGHFTKPKQVQEEIQELHQISERWVCQHGVPPLGSALIHPDSKGCSDRAPVRLQHHATPTSRDTVEPRKQLF